MSTNTCAVCSKPVPATSLCGGCHQVAYCGKEHQKYDWPQHKRACRQPGTTLKDIIRKIESTESIPDQLVKINEFAQAFFGNVQQIKNQATPNYDGLIEQGAEILRFYSTLKQKIVQPQDCLTLLPQAMREELERSFVLDNDISLAEGLGINHFALFSIDRHVDNVQIHLGILYQAKQAAQKNRKID